jgi:hypothetical protein
MPRKEWTDSDVDESHRHDEKEVAQKAPEGMVPLIHLQGPGEDPSAARGGRTVVSPAAGRCLREATNFQMSSSLLKW